MKRLLLYIFLLPVTGFVKAQVPGYMEKKLMIGIEGVYSPAYSALVKLDGDPLITYDHKGQEQNMFLYTPAFGVAIKYTVAADRVLSLGIRYQQTGVAIAADPFLAKDPSLHASDLTDGASFQYAVAGFTTISLGLTHTEATAPIGYYSGPSLMLIRANTQAIDAGGKMYQLDAVFDFGIAEEVGIRRVVRDRVVIDAGASLSLYAKGFSRLALKRLYTGDENHSLRDEVLGRALIRNWINNVFSFHVGVYYLI